MPRSVRSLAGIVLVLAVLVSLSAASAHSGQHCFTHHDCLACRWAANSVVVLAAPLPPLGLECTGVVHPSADEIPAASSPIHTSSRAPPRG
jgi:hypothetical protein